MLVYVIVFCLLYNICHAFLLSGHRTLAKIQHLLAVWVQYLLAVWLSFTGLRYNGTQYTNCLPFSLQQNGVHYLLVVWLFCTSPDYSTRLLLHCILLAQCTSPVLLLCANMKHNVVVDIVRRHRQNPAVP